MNGRKPREKKYQPLVSRALKEFRVSRGLTQAQFAEILEMSDKHIQSLENNRASVNIEVLGKLRKMGFSVDAALDGEVNATDEVLSIINKVEKLPPDELHRVRRVIEAMYE